MKGFGAVGLTHKYEFKKRIETMKIGDRVKFLSETGGGRIAGFQGKNIALVEDEDGFQIPTPLSDLVLSSSSDE